MKEGSESLSAPIYEPFRSLYRFEFGKAQAEQPQKFSYYGVHQHAIVIWFEELNAFYKLKLQPQEWECYMDPDRNPDPKFGDLTWRLGQDWSLDESQPSTGYQPPFSGVAKNWLNEPEKWKWIGWLNWHCNYFNYEKPPIHYQEFENAIMVGGFPSSQGGTDTRVFILKKNDHSWTGPQLPMSAPDCVRPEEMYARPSP